MINVEFADGKPVPQQKDYSFEQILRMDGLFETTNGTKDKVIVVPSDMPNEYCCLAICDGGLKVACRLYFENSRFIKLPYDVKVVLTRYDKA